MWSGQGTAVKVLDRHMGPIAITFLPFYVTTFLFVPLLLKMRAENPGASNPSARDWIQFVVAGVAGQVLAQLGMTWGVSKSLASNGALYRSLDYSPITDLSPVSLVAKFPFFMFVPNPSPAKTVKEFIDYVKAHPGNLIMASPGTGSGPHLAELLFLQMAGIQMAHAPYRGAAPAFTDLIPGRVHGYFGSGELLTYSRSGQVRVLASTGDKRSAARCTRLTNNSPARVAWLVMTSSLRGRGTALIRKNVETRAGRD